MGNRPGLVQVIVNSIHTELCQIHPSGNCVHVCPVHVDQAASGMNPVRDRPEMGFKYPAGIRIGDHDCRQPITKTGHLVIEIGHVHAACPVGFKDHYPGVRPATPSRYISGHSRRREIGSMRRLREQDHITVPLPIVVVVGLYELEPNQLALSTGHRLGSHPSKSGDSLEPLLGFVQHFKTSLRRF